LKAGAKLKAALPTPELRRVTTLPNGLVKLDYAVGSKAE
jgi:hypothetical protein